MTQIYLKLVKGEWEEVLKSRFWIDLYLLIRLKNLKKIQGKGWDGVIIIDGKERSGKSILGMICAWFLSNGKMGIDNFARGLDDAANKIAKLPDGSILIMDEGSLVFSSKDSMSKAQKKLLKIMDVVGQKNMIFIICLPCYFDLNKTIAVRRSLFLLHVYPDKKYNRGRYAGWGERRKKELYIHGKRNFDSYAYPKADFKGMFMDFEPPFYKDYLEIVKKESLQEVLKDAQQTTKSVKQVIIELEAIFYGWILENTSFKQKDLSKIKGQPRTTISDRYILYKEMKSNDSLGK